MSILLIVYDSPTQDYSPLSRFAEGFDAMRFSECAYAIQTDASAADIYGQIQPLLRRDEIAYVLTITSPWIGFGYEAMNDWLKRHLHG